MRTNDIPSCPYFIDTGATFENNGFIQYDPVDGPIVMLVHCDGTEHRVESFQRSNDGGTMDDTATGWIATHDNGTHVCEVMDDQDFTLRIYTCQRVL